MIKGKIVTSNVITSLFFAFVIVSFFMPKLTSSDTLSYLLIDVVCICIAVLIITVSLKKKFPLGIFCFFIGLNILFVLALLYAKNSSEGDLYDMIRPLMYFSFFLVGYLVTTSWQRFILVFTTIIIVLSICALISIMQAYLDIANWSILYTKSANIISHRSTATFINPYDAAVMISFVFIFYLLKFFYKNSSFFTTIKNLCLLLFLGLACIVTESRTFIIAIVPSILFSSFLVVKLPIVKKIYLCKIFVFIILIMLFTLVSMKMKLFPYLTAGTKSFLTHHNDSWNIRDHQMSYILNNIFSLHSLILGHGPDKNNIDLLYIENQYFLYLYRYGLIGLFAIIFILFFPLIIAVKLFYILSKYNRVISFELLTIIAWLFLLIIAGFTNPYVDMTRDGQMFFLVFGSLFSLKKLNSINLPIREKNTHV